MKDAPSLIEEVAAAFAGMASPRKDDIAPHRCLECDELRDELDGQEPSAVLEDVMHRYRWDLPLLSDNAKKYYLPAWLIRAIQDPVSDYAESVVHAVAADHRWSPVAPYTPQQWQCIRAVLEYIASNTDEYSRQEAESALARITNAA